MNTQCTGSAIGTGEYRAGTPYSELKLLVQEGERVMTAHGLEGEDLHRASHIYARTMLHFYEQSGWQPLNKNLENEFVERVIAELAIGSHPHRSSAISAGEFNFGIDPHSARMEGLDPFTPATFPDPDPHPHPKTPEEQVEPLLDPIIDRHDARCCARPNCSSKP
jgi:hypothetical protein